MSDWTAGYVADIGYTYGYYAELNPLRSRLLLLNKGIVAPTIKNACELGFGQGLSTNIHAAASGINWYGTDFNPSQAAYARELADVSGSGAKLYDDAFAEFAARTDLPEFEFICLHGIWSWISDANRQVLVDFIQRKLAVGGVLYISYNTLPGWSSFAPVRHLMTQHEEVIGAGGQGIVQRINAAIEFADQLLSLKPGFAQANPQAHERLKKLKEQNRQYLAHEYFNKDWHPMHFSTITDWLMPAKVQFACSAGHYDTVDSLHFNADQQQFLNKIPDATLKESVRDFMVNQQFRRDYWIKGARSISGLEQVDAIRKERVILMQDPSAVNLKVTGALGEASLNKEIYLPVLDAMADYKVRSIGQLEQLLKTNNIQLAQLVQAVLILMGHGALQPVQEDSHINKAAKTTEKLNNYFKAKAPLTATNNYFASPVFGGAVHVGRIQQLFLGAIDQGKKQPDEWAAYAWSVLNAQAQKIIKDGKPLATDQENIDELKEQARIFALKGLQIFKQLKIC